MKWFWYSLTAFCLLMFSCKTQKFASEIDFVSKESVQSEYIRTQTLVNTTNVIKTFTDKSKIKIIESITITEYDATTGKPTKKTETERTIAQDSDKALEEEETKGVAEESDVLVKQESDFSKTLDSKEELESIGGQESFGKWFGIVIGVVVGLLLLYLFRK